MHLEKSFIYFLLWEICFSPFLMCSVKLSFDHLTSNLDICRRRIALRNKKGELSHILPYLSTRPRYHLWASLGILFFFYPLYHGRIFVFQSLSLCHISILLFLHITSSNLKRLFHWLYGSLNAFISSTFGDHLALSLNIFSIWFIYALTAPHMYSLKASPKTPIDLTLLNLMLVFASHNCLTMPSHLSYLSHTS